MAILENLYPHAYVNDAKREALIISAGVFFLILPMVLWFCTGSGIPVVVACALLGVVILHVTSRKAVCGLFLVICVLTEFYWIQFLGGSLRPYHLFAPIVCVLLSASAKQLISSSQFLLLGGFLISNLCSTVMAQDVPDALLSFLLVCASASVGVATALILISGAMNVTAFKRTILAATIVSLAWGLIQYIGHAAAGINLALSETQRQNIEWNMIPAVRTEADTFGKYLLFPFMLFIPALVEKKTRASKPVLVFYVAATFCLTVSLVRTSLYGCIVGIMYILYWSKKRGTLAPYLKYILLITLAISVIVALSLQGVLPVGDYVQQKFRVAFNFNLTHLEQDDSGSFRVANIRSILEGALNDIHTIFWGRGWGQTYFYWGGEQLHTIAGDGLHTFAYGGLFGSGLYMLYTVNAFLAFRRAAMQRADHAVARFGEGMMYAMIAMFTTSLFAGYFLAPEYWILIGCSIFADWKMAKTSWALPTRRPRMRMRSAVGWR
jgi:hypothetical protein